MLAVHSLSFRLLAVIVLAVALALITVVVVARRVTSLEFERYVERQRQEMQAVAEKVAETTGDRLIIANAEGQVIVDSSRELIGQSVDDRPGELPMPAGASRMGVMVLRQDTAPVEPDRGMFWLREPAAFEAGRASESTLEAPLASAPLRALEPSFQFGVPAPEPEALDSEGVFINSVNAGLLAAVLVAGLAAILLAWIVSRQVLRPVHALTAAARGMEAGDLNQRVAVRSRDELGQLASAFNSMAGALARTEALRRQMVTDVAHELRTPLTNLRGYLEALHEGVTQPTPAVLDSLHEEAVLLSRLVDDLRDLSLGDAGQLTLEPARTSLQALIERAVVGMQLVAEEKGITLTIEEPSKPLETMDVDRERIGQVLRNLLTNAIAHTPPGGTVHVSAERTEDPLGIRVRVADTGEGIPAEHVPNVFERFYRADPARARSTGGAGIGLAVVKQLVEAHGGTVALQSTVGSGTTVDFTLPLGKATA